MTNNNEYLAIDLSTSMAHIAWGKYNYAESKIDASISNANNDYLQKAIIKNSTKESQKPKNDQFALPANNASKYFASHNETLVQDIELLRTSIQGAYHRLRAIIINMGPGSFTGLRVALSFAKGLQAGLRCGAQQALSEQEQCAIIGIGTMEYLACISVGILEESSGSGCSCKAGSDAASPLLCILDARSKKFYCQFFVNAIIDSNIDTSANTNAIKELSIDTLLAKILQCVETSSELYISSFDTAMVLNALRAVCKDSSLLERLKIVPINSVDYGLALLDLGIGMHIEGTHILGVDSTPHYIRDAV